MAPRPPADRHRLEHFYPAPPQQGGGPGSSVLPRPLERRERDRVTVRLTVPRGSPARRLHERHGFTAVSEDAVDTFMIRAPSPRPQA